MAGCPLPYARSLSEVSPTLQWHRWAANDAALLHVCPAGRKKERKGWSGTPPPAHAAHHWTVGGPWSVVSCQSHHPLAHAAHHWTARGCNRGTNASRKDARTRRVGGGGRSEGEKERPRDG